MLRYKDNSSIKLPGYGKLMTKYQNNLMYSNHAKMSFVKVPVWTSV
jgi:hypothetical protein